LPYPRFARLLLPCLALSCCLLAADSPDPSDVSDWTETFLHLPIARWLFPSLSPPQPPQPSASLATCKIGPLPPITDPEALEFERSVSPTTSGLVPAMTRALLKFEDLVRSVGGTFVLKSAYRPPAYQAHLQQVWYKWMDLRNNREPGCQPLREEVRAEFDGHHLMESQKPVDSSDHTRGMAFDATVEMPRAPRIRRTPVTLDRLALLAGIMRPDILHDPVHYKLAATRVVAGRVSRRSNGRYRTS
jgi:hypothetical protein